MPQPPGPQGELKVGVTPQPPGPHGDAQGDGQQGCGQQIGRQQVTGRQQVVGQNHQQQASLVCGAAPTRAAATPTTAITLEMFMQGSSSDVDSALAKQQTRPGERG
jgi:hypothetical protein